VEKPLAITAAQVDELEQAWRAARSHARKPQLMVGFNRRFAPQVVRTKALLGAMREPKIFTVCVNAGAIPRDHWTQDREIGGGRIIGEACHFIDLLRFLAGVPIEDANIVASRGADGRVRDDVATITLLFTDGSLGTIQYFANGHKDVPKERIEVSCAGRMLQLDNFRKLRGHGWPRFSRMNLWRQDKGQHACARAFLDTLRKGEESPIPFEEIIEVARVSIRLGEAARH
jgi:predicted dehydrogenase